MSETQEAEIPELPDGWRWGLGEAGESYYDYWCYSDNGQWEGHQYHDRGQQHTVEFIEILGYDENDDPEFDYSSHVRGFDSEEEAEAYLIEKAGELA